MVQRLNQQSREISPKPVYRVFRLAAQLYIFHPDLPTFRLLEDMPSNLPKQIWSAVQDLNRISAGMVRAHRKQSFPAIYPDMNRQQGHSPMLHYDSTSCMQACACLHAYQQQTSTCSHYTCTPGQLDQQVLCILHPSPFPTTLWSAKL